MFKHPSTRKAQADRASSGEDGYVLIGVLFLVVVILIGLAVAAPKVATSIRRDKELELYHRGMQYTRAIRLYYKKFGNYPTSLDQLENTGNIRFLRKRYKDPFTGKDDWRLIHFGEAKVAATGFFGQPIGAAGAAGTNSSGSNGQLGTGSSGGSSPFSNSFSNNGGSSSSSSPTGTPGDPGSGASPSGPGVAGGTGSGFGGSSTGGAAGLGGSTLTSSSGSPIGSTGPIVGIASIVTKESIRELKKQKHYNEWEFVYNPQTDQGGLGGNNGQGVNNGASGAPVNGVSGQLPGGGSGLGGGTSNPGGGSGLGGGTLNPGSGSGFGSSSPGGGDQPSPTQHPPNQGDSPNQ